MSPENIFSSINFPLLHKNQKVRTLASKILFDLHTKTGVVNTQLLKDIPKNIRDTLLKQIKEIQVDKDVNF